MLTCESGSKFGSHTQSPLQANLSLHQQRWYVPNLICSGLDFFFLVCKKFSIQRSAFMRHDIERRDLDTQRTGKFWGTDKACKRKDQIHLMSRGRLLALKIKKDLEEDFNI